MLMFLLAELLAPGHPSEVLATGRYRTEGANERIAHRACEGAHRQWAHTALDVAHAAPNVVRAAGRFPRTSHVQHPI
jgi:hypothetical protein